MSAEGGESAAAAAVEVAGSCYNRELMVINSYYVFEDFTKSSGPSSSHGGGSEGGDFSEKNSEKSLCAHRAAQTVTWPTRSFCFSVLIRFSVLSSPDAPGLCQVTPRKAGTE